MDLPLSLLAVHISDGPLAGSWLLVGAVLAVFLALVGAWGITEEEIPRVAVLTAAFFVAGSLRVPLGPYTVHLLLNGLLGVVLGRRAALAIPVGMLMQAVFLGHGGMSTVGVNSCIQMAPALAAWQLFHVLRERVGPAFGAVLIGLSVFGGLLSLVFSVALLWAFHWGGSASVEEALSVAADSVFRLVVIVPAGLLAAAAAWLEARLKNAPEFPLGFLVGELTVLLTVVLQTTVLILGGEQDWRTWALIGLVTHIPVAVIEGLVLGSTVGYLARVKPEMLGWTNAEEPACTADARP